MPILLLEARHRPRREVSGDVELLQLRFYLLLKLFLLDGLLRAVRVLLFRAMVVRVMCETAAGELLHLLLGRNKGSALTAPYRPPVRHIASLLGARVAAATEQELDAVVFLAAHQRFVQSRVPLAAADGVLELAVIEGTSEDVIDIAAAYFLSVRRAQAPLVSSDAPYLRWCVVSREHQVYHLTEQWEALRIGIDLLLTALLVLVVLIAKRRWRWVIAHLRPPILDALPPRHR